MDAKANVGTPVVPIAVSQNVYTPMANAVRITQKSCLRALVIMIINIDLKFLTDIVHTANYVRHSYHGAEVWVMAGGEAFAQYLNVQRTVSPYRVLM